MKMKATIDVEFESEGEGAERPAALKYALSSGIRELLHGIVFAAGPNKRLGVRTGSVKAVVSCQEISE